MALHRDIYWVGRQWAVTGYGLQACDQKQKSPFDIEANRLWEDGVLESVRAQKWLNAEDFEKALEIARKRYPGPPRNAAQPAKEQPPREIIVPASPGPPIAPLPPTPRLAEPKPQRLVAVELQQKIAELKASLLARRDAVEPPQPAAPRFHVSFNSTAKFVTPWRLRQRSQ